MKPIRNSTLPALLAGILATSSALAVPSLVNYQGFVTDSNGAPIGQATPENRKLVFKVYSTATAGVILWAEEHTATLVDGRFSVLLGNGAQFGSEPHSGLDAIFKSGADYYVGITVDNGDGSFNQNDLEISPRQRIVSSVFALRAATADSIASGRDLSLGADNGLGFYDSSRQFNGLDVNGPVLYGTGGGALGAQTAGAQTTALRWNSAGDVTNSGNLTVAKDLAVTKNLNVTQNTAIAGNLAVTGSIFADGGIALGGFAADPDFVGTTGNSIAFGHDGASEDFIGYKNNTFYLRDSIGGGDDTEPNLNVGGDITAIGSGSFNTLNTTALGNFGSLSSSGQISTASNLRASNGLYLYPSDQNHGVQYLATFDTVGVNGAVLYGYDGGALGSVRGTEDSDPTNDTQKIALQWDGSGNVDAKQNLTVKAEPVATSAAGVRIVSGIIGGNGSIISGSGFSVVKSRTGEYRVTFDKPFGSIPAVTVTPYNSGSKEYSQARNDTFTAEEKKSNVYVQSLYDGNLTDHGVSFIAVGQR